MGWRREARSSSDVGQWSTALRQLAGDFAISATSVECYGLSHMCFCLQLSSNVITRVWIDNLYHIKPAKYHGVGTLMSYRSVYTSSYMPIEGALFPTTARCIVNRNIAGTWPCQCAIIIAWFLQKKSKFIYIPHFSRRFRDV